MKPAGIPADEKRLNLVVGQRYIQIFDAADQGAVLTLTTCLSCSSLNFIVITCFQCMPLADFCANDRIGS